MIDAHLLSLLIATPALGALFISLLPSRATAAIRSGSIAVLTVELLLALRMLRGDFSTANLQYLESHPWIETLGISYRVGVDGLSLGLVLLTTLVAPFALAVSWHNVRERHKSYAIAFLMLQSALVGAFSAVDLAMFYICWELTLLPVYFLIGIWGGKRRIQAATKLFLYTMVGSLLMLVALFYTAQAYAELNGSFSFDLRELRRVAWPESVQIWLFAAFALAFAIKLPIFPLHSWLPDSYSQAPIGTTVMMAAVLSKLGAYGLLRVATPLFPLGSYLLGPTLAALGVAGIVYAAFCAWAQLSPSDPARGLRSHADLLRLIAYASFGHLGFLVVGLMSMEPSGVEGATLHMIGHGVSTAALLILVALWQRRSASPELVSAEAASLPSLNLGGLATTMPIFAVLMFVTLMSALGLPGTSGFIGEFLVLSGAFSAVALQPWSWALVLGALMGVVLGAVYVLNLLGRFLWGESETSASTTTNQNAVNPSIQGSRDLSGRTVSPARDLSGREVLLVAPFVVAILWIGLAPQSLLRYSEPSVASYLEEVRRRLRLIPTDAPKLADSMRAQPSRDLPR